MIGAVEFDVLISEVAEQAAVYGLDEVDGVEVGPERRAEVGPGGDPQVALVELGDLAERVAVAVADALEQGREFWILVRHCRDSA